MEKAKKDDKGKVDLTYLDPYALEQAAWVMMASVESGKYKRGNWMKPMDLKKMIAAMKRHILKLEKGTAIDTESGYRHSSHLICDAMIIDYHLRHGVELEREYE